MMISAVILSHDSASSIQKTLESVSWCDEIICIDDFSTDGTVKIAEKHKARIFQRHLSKDFAGQRNFGLEKAHGDWILFVDSDEIVPQKLKEEILLKISNIKVKDQKDEINGYYIRRTDRFFGRELKYGETAHIKLLRLAKKDKGIWVRPVHEYWDVKGPVQALINPLLHYPHPNVAQFISEINTYTTINAEYLSKRGVRSNLFEIIAYPKGKFFLNYLLRLGFLDGPCGFIMAVLMSFHSFLTRAKLYILIHKH
jgi:glycosyltransferase involved in cell wall biosynthesis